MMMTEQIMKNKIGITFSKEEYMELINHGKMEEAYEISNSYYNELIKCEEPLEFKTDEVRKFMPVLLPQPSHDASLLMSLLYPIYTVMISGDSGPAELSAKYLEELINNQNSSKTCHCCISAIPYENLYHEYTTHYTIRCDSLELRTSRQTAQTIKEILSKNGIKSDYGQSETYLKIKIEFLDDDFKVFRIVT